jgi:uncharacterized membrane protein (UPF0182 family)
MTLRRVTAVIAIVGFLIALNLAAGFVVDWFWFSAIGYRDVFFTIFGAKAALFLAVFGVSAILLWLNGFAAYRLAGRKLYLRASFPWDDRTSIGPLVRLPEPTHWRFLLAGGTLVIATLIALGEVSNWEVALRFIWQTSYGQSDPLYGRDIGFYLFSLPAYIALKNWMLLVLILSALTAAAIYWIRGSLILDRPVSVASRVIAHGLVLLGFFFAVQAWS